MDSGARGPGTRRETERPRVPYAYGTSFEQSAHGQVAEHGLGMMGVGRGSRVNASGVSVGAASDGIHPWGRLWRCERGPG